MEIGPKPLREVMGKAAENPELMRLVYAAEAGSDFWLAQSQIKKQKVRIFDPRINTEGRKKRTEN